MYTERCNRAIEFLKRKGHDIGTPNDGIHIVVDGKSFQVDELHLFAEQQHRADWIQCENAWLADFLAKNKPDNV